MKARSQHRSMRQDIHREPSRREWRWQSSAQCVWLKRQSAKFTRANADDFIQEGLADREDQIRLGKYQASTLEWPYLKQPSPDCRPIRIHETGWNIVQGGVYNHLIPR